MTQLLTGRVPKDTNIVLDFKKVFLLPVHGAVIPGAQTVKDQFRTPIFIKVDILQDSVAADGQQDILLQLLVLGKRFHGIEIRWKRKCECFLS